MGVNLSSLSNAQSDPDRRKSATVRVLGNPSIKETIGYILYEYTRQKRMPPAKVL